MSDIVKMLRECSSDEAYLSRQAADEITRLTARVAKLEWACSATQHDIQQTLGKALNYPWYKDDQKNFPNATEADGVCVGEHVAESLADETVTKITALRAEVEQNKIDLEEYRRDVEKLRAALEPFADMGKAMMGRKHPNEAVVQYALAPTIKVFHLVAAHETRAATPQEPTAFEMFPPDDEYNWGDT